MKEEKIKELKNFLNESVANRKMSNFAIAKVFCVSRTFITRHRFDLEVTGELAFKSSNTLQRINVLSKYIHSLGEKEFKKRFKVSDRCYEVLLGEKSFTEKRSDEEKLFWDKFNVFKRMFNHKNIKPKSAEDCDFIYKLLELNLIKAEFDDKTASFRIEVI